MLCQIEVDATKGFEILCHTEKLKSNLEKSTNKQKINRTWTITFLCEKTLSTHAVLNISLP